MLVFYVIAGAFILGLTVAIVSMSPDGAGLAIVPACIQALCVCVCMTVVYADDLDRTARGEVQLSYGPQMELGVAGLLEEMAMFTMP